MILPQTRNSFNLHDPYRHIHHYMTDNLGFTSFSNAIDIHYDYAQLLKNAYHDYIPGSIDYNNSFLQNAYMLLYFPLYIETIAHIGSRIPSSIIDETLIDNPNICIYGGGAIPEYFGFLNLINSRFQGIRLKCHIFDSVRLVWLEKLSG